MALFSDTPKRESEGAHVCWALGKGVEECASVRTLGEDLLKECASTGRAGRESKRVRVGGDSGGESEANASVGSLGEHLKE